jgi:hypothetical protein
MIVFLLSTNLINTKQDIHWYLYINVQVCKQVTPAAGLPPSADHLAIVLELTEEQPSVEPPLPSWKELRWVDWAIKNGIIPSKKKKLAFTIVNFFVHNLYAFI